MLLICLAGLETTIVVAHLDVPQTIISPASTTITHVTDSVITASAIETAPTHPNIGNVQDYLK